ncbi:MAG: class I SAM-dependent methyltransferase [Bacteroidetes bacterium]|nr:MAG: class I SAM-dependent methyltransferase [Bacteroidota bacterium]
MDIPLSPSDRLLQSRGYDLFSEYDEIVRATGMPAGPVLELATGTGRMCAVLTQHYPLVVTGDISLDGIPRVRQRVPAAQLGRLAFLQLDMERLPFRDRSVPFILCVNTLHETAAPRRCLEEMLRVLRPGGVLAVGDFNETGFDTMQWIHEEVYHNDHERGAMPVGEAEPVLRTRGGSLRRLETALNTTFILSGVS